MKPQLTSACLVMTLSLLTSAPATAENRSGAVAPQRQVKVPRPPAKPPHSSPAESRAERDQRLRRECRGKPNAGACEGYAS